MAKHGTSQDAESELFDEPEYRRLMSFCKDLSDSEEQSAETRELNQPFADFKLEKVLYRGNTGDVFLARQNGSEQPCALKILNPQTALEHDQKAQMIRRFEREARIAATVDQRNLIVATQAAEFEDRLYYCMEYVNGKSLKNRIRANLLSNRRTAETIRAIAATIHQLHLSGIFHGRLKPANILFDSRDRVYLLGIGAAAFCTNIDHSSAENNAKLDAISYIAPEQIRDRAFASPASEVWSLGAIIYHCLTGETPFHSPDRTRILARIEKDEPTPLSQRNSRIAKDLETICLKCLNKNPANRYENAQELANDLNRFLEYEPIEATRCGLVERSRKWFRRLKFRIAG